MIVRVIPDVVHREFAREHYGLWQLAMAMSFIAIAFVDYQNTLRSLPRASQA